MSVDPNDHNAVINLTQRKLIEAIESGVTLSKNDIAAIKAASKTATDMLRIDIDSDGSAATRELAMAMMSVAASTASNPFKVVSGGSIPESSSILDEVELIEGEDLIDDSSQDFESFTAKMGLLEKKDD